jgi:hypothetical protein
MPNETGTGQNRIGQPNHTHLFVKPYFLMRPYQFPQILLELDSSIAREEFLGEVGFGEDPVD